MAGQSGCVIVGQKSASEIAGDLYDEGWRAIKSDGGVVRVALDCKAPELPEHLDEEVLQALVEVTADCCSAVRIHELF